MNSEKTPKNREKTDCGDNDKKVWKWKMCLYCVPVNITTVGAVWTTWTLEMDDPSITLFQK